MNIKEVNGSSKSLLFFKVWLLCLLLPVIFFTIIAIGMYVKGEIKANLEVALFFFGFYALLFFVAMAGAWKRSKLSTNTIFICFIYPTGFVISVQLLRRIGCLFASVPCEVNSDKVSSDITITILWLFLLAGILLRRTNAVKEFYIKKLD